MAIDVEELEQGLRQGLHRELGSMRLEANRGRMTPRTSFVAKTL